MILRKLLPILLLGSSFGLAAAEGAPTTVCTGTAATPLIRSEGITERMGDIVLFCTSTPGATITGNLSVFLSVNITNKISTGNTVDAVLSVDTGSGPVSTGATPLLLGANSISFAGMNFTVPASGAFSFRLSNLRGAAAAQGPDNTSPILAFLSSDASGISFTQTTFAVGVPQRGLTAGISSTIVNCYGSPVPDALSVPGFISAHSAVSATRVSEGFLTAFAARQPGEDSGTRIIVRFTGFPAAARLFVPDAVAGSDANQPTATGVLHGAATGGSYLPGSGSLLLVRVLKADANGAGGTLAFTASGSQPVALVGANELTLTNGAGFAVYEVVDANPAVQESAEIPTWLGLPPTGGAVNTASNETVTLAPVSDITAASATAPVPRFVPVEPKPDCTAVGDCTSFPKLVIKADSLAFTIDNSSSGQNRWVGVGNTGGGFLGWAANLTYKTGSNWAELVIIPNHGAWGGVNVKVYPKGMAPGTYEAVLSIDAGPAGGQTFPLTLTVTQATPGTGGNPNAPQVNAFVHAATFQPGPVVPGSLVSLMGTHLKGNAVDVTFDAISAPLLYVGDNQINLEVPPQLAGHSSAVLTVTVDGVASRSEVVNLISSAPGVFSGGILNQDNTVNGPSNPAAGDSIIQVFATGLPSTDAAKITAKIHDVWIDTPDYSGPAPGIMGVQQVNLRVPAGWPRMDTSIVLCSTDLRTSVRTCSPQASFSVK